MNIHRLLLIASLAALLVSGGACSNRRHHAAGPAEGSDSASAAASLGAGQPGGRGRGLGPASGPGRGLGRGLGRRWAEGQSVVLSDAQLNTVEILTSTAVVRPMRSLIKAMGKLFVPQPHKAIVSYPFPARIAEIHAVVGDWVKPGQKLVTLQSEEVGTARAEYDKARTDLELARQNLEREKALFERGAGAQKNVFSAEAQFKVAQAMLDAAEKKLHILGFDEAQVQEMTSHHEVFPLITLFSPIAGKIVESKAVLGAMIDQSVEIMTLMDPSLLWVEAEVYERDISRVKVGQETEVAVPAYPGEIFKGRVTYIGDILNEETRTISVRTEVRNADSKLKPGMFADVTLAVDEEGRAIVIPQEAVLEDAGESIVFVPAAGGFTPRVVRVGMQDDGFIQILEGLKEGEEVVTSGAFQLKSKLYQDILKAAGVH